jgi:UPF0271 protein
MTLIDLNSDLGESWGVYSKGEDQAVLSIITSANVACGYHAGDPTVMRDTLQTAKLRGVAVGAHPSYLDLPGFGRRRIVGDSLEVLERQIAYQIGALQGIAAITNTAVTHVKSHGSLGNVVAEDDEVALSVAKAIKSVDPNLIMVVMPGMATERAGEKVGLRLAREVYADRGYQDNGNLIPRGEKGAIIKDPTKASERVLIMLEEQAVTTNSGKKIPGRIDTICVHGDNPSAVNIATQIRASIVENGITLKPFHEFV